MQGTANNKVLVNLATGLEDAERVTVAFLVATAALSQGKQVVTWATKEAVRLGLPGEAAGVACKGCRPLERLFEQFADGGGELWLCPICVEARDLGDAEKVPMSRLWALHRCGSGPATTRPSSVTDPAGPVTGSRADGVSCAEPPYPKR